jgi:hypothetical protein
MESPNRSGPLTKSTGASMATKVQNPVNASLPTGRSPKGG